MSEYEFILKFRLADAEADPDDHVVALIEAGCDDAAIGIGQLGRIALDFTRKAESADEAIASALRAVRLAIPGAELIEVSPDLVGLTDVADLLGCSRQNIRKLVIKNMATFPIAVHEGSLMLWHLRPVLDWFCEAQARSINHSLIEVSDAAMRLNIAKEARQVPGVRLPKDLESLFV